MASVYAMIGDSELPGHFLRVHEDEYGAFHLSCSICEWEHTEHLEDNIPKDWHYNHHVYASLQMYDWMNEFL